MNILIVDDEKDILEEIGFYVKKYEGFIQGRDYCTLCNNPQEAINQANIKKFDIALLDIGIPTMNGLELAERLGEINPKTNMAFITAYNHYAAEAFELNAIDYILKPIREERLAKTLKKLFDLCILTQREYAGINKSSINIKTFGKFSVTLENNIVKWERQKSAELFAYLLENKSMSIHKEKLCEILWPELDTQKALVNLQTTIYSIRKKFSNCNEEEIKIEYTFNSYILEIKNTEIDNESFEKLLKHSLEHNNKLDCDKAKKIYSGDYLEEDGWGWAIPKKEMLRKKYEKFCK